MREWWNGRHAGLRIQCLRAWGFKSPLSHQFKRIRTNLPERRGGRFFLYFFKLEEAHSEIEPPMPRRKNTTDCKGLLFLLSGSDDPMLGLSEELWSKLMEAAIASSFFGYAARRLLVIVFPSLPTMAFQAIMSVSRRKRKTSNQRRRHASSSFRHPAP